MSSSDSSGGRIRPWALSDVGDGKPRSESLTIGKERLKMPTAEEIEALRQAAMEEGRAEGHAEGHEAGYAQGQREALEATRADIEQRLRQLDSIIATLDQPLAELDQELEQSLLELAIAIARQLVRREIRTDPGQILAVVREALAALPSRSRHIRLHLHPEDAVLVEQAYAQVGGQTEWRIEQDAGLSRGGCRVITDVSRIDASLEQRFARIIAPLLNDDRLPEPGQAAAPASDEAAPHG